MGANNMNSHIDAGPNKGLPMPVTQGKGIRQLICFHNTCCVFGTIFVMLVAMSVTVLCLVAFGLNPKESTYILENVQVTTLNVSVASSSEDNTTALETKLSYGLILSVKAFNPNKKMSIFYQNMRMAISYKDIILGERSFNEELYQGHQNETNLDMTLHADDIVLSKDAAFELEQAISNNVIPLQVEMEIHARIIVQGSWKKYIRSGDKCSLKDEGAGKPLLLQGKSCIWKEYLYKCGVEVSPPAAPGGARMLSKSCIWKANLYNKD
ncbi:hypothetical protein O6H91_07G028400 [Diphasiastrum complanatum]|uniref:Uncharacterized protein n=1 Tax=Diphasiastrum complanatum TaxID=34168 RepID=A0ACC2D3G5_DIPCM|nr:hypothetical protein O6H91_07G028400 [Diphasiastrum complanatum]